MSLYLIETEDPITKCSECPCMDEDSIDTRLHLCGLKHQLIASVSEKPDWCPLVAIEE
jgi:hypothetical protein